MAPYRRTCKLSVRRCPQPRCADPNRHGCWRRHRDRHADRTRSEEAPDVEPNEPTGQMGPFAHPHDSRGRVHHHAVGRDASVDGAPITERQHRIAGATLVAQHADQIFDARASRQTGQELVGAGAARERARFGLYLKVRGIVGPGALEVVGERGLARATTDDRRFARRALDDGDVARRVGQHDDVAHHGLALASMRMASSVERASPSTSAHRVHQRLAAAARLARAPAVNDEGEALRVHAGQRADEPGPGDRC